MAAGVEVVWLTDSTGEDATQGLSAASSELDVLLEQLQGFPSSGDWILRRLCEKPRACGTTPTPVQQHCIPPILEGRDVIGVALTGSGKTAAFVLPLLQTMAEDPYGIFTLVLTPTRELAFQLAEQFKALSAGMALKDCIIVGGLEMQRQAAELVRRPHVVVATPGRLAELVRGDGDIQRAFSRVRALVLDEADRLLDATFEADLRAILSQLPSSRQTLLFSATMTNSLVKLQEASLEGAFVWRAYEGLKTAEGLKEQYLFIPANVKEVYLAHLLGALEARDVKSAMVFCAKRSGCQLLHATLLELDIPCTSLHGGLPQRERLAALSCFKSRQVPILVATDVASRGLDIPTVDLVVNFDLPMEPKDYVHRVGRTARANRGGWSLSFVSQYDVELLQAVEAVVGHQLSAFTLEERDVLKGITCVYTARRTAALRLQEQAQLRAERRPG